MWECLLWSGERELHLVVRDRGDLLDGREPTVRILNLETGELDYELTKWLDDPETTGWERVL